MLLIIKSNVGVSTATSRYDILACWWERGRDWKRQKSLGSADIRKHHKNCLFTVWVLKNIYLKSLNRNLFLMKHGRTTGARCKLWSGLLCCWIACSLCFPTFLVFWIWEFLVRVEPVFDIQNAYMCAFIIRACNAYIYLTCAHVFIYTYIYMYLHIHIHIHIYTYINMCIHIHVHIHTYT